MNNQDAASDGEDRSIGARRAQARCTCVRYSLREFVDRSVAPYYFPHLLIPPFAASTLHLERSCGACLVDELEIIDFPSEEFKDIPDFSFFAGCSSNRRGSIKSKSNRGGLYVDAYTLHAESGRIFENSGTEGLSRPCAS